MVSACYANSLGLVSPGVPVMRRALHRGKVGAMHDPCPGTVKFDDDVEILRTVKLSHDSDDTPLAVTVE